MITLPFSIKEAHPLSRLDTDFCLLPHTFLAANLDLTSTDELDLEILLELGLKSKLRLEFREN